MRCASAIYESCGLGEDYDDNRFAAAERPLLRKNWFHVTMRFVGVALLVAAVWLLAVTVQSPF